MPKGASRKDIRFFGRWVGFQKLDMTMLKQPLHWVKIGDGWVGRSKNGLRNWISFVDGPLLRAPSGAPCTIQGNMIHNTHLHKYHFAQSDHEDKYKLHFAKFLQH